MITGLSSVSFSVVALMCGRTVVSLAPDDMMRACTFRDRKGKRRRPEWKDAPGGQQYRTSYNMAPGSFTPVMVSGDHFGDGEQDERAERILTPMKWGLVPPWHDGDPFKVPYETNNSRMEGMLEKKTYKVPLHRGNRCVILADGFYEWKTLKDGKQPYYFYFPQNNDSAFLDKDEKGLMAGKTEDKLKIKFEAEKLEIKEQPVDEKEEADDDDDDDELLMEAMNMNRFNSPPSCVESPSEDVLKTSRDIKTEIHESKEKNVVIASQMSFSETKQEIKSIDLNQNQPSLSTNITSLTSKSFVTQTKNDIEVEENQDWIGNRPLTIAGVFEVWNASKGCESLYSYSVITVPASKDMDWCHHRMPAILPTEDAVRDWLDFANIPMQKASSLIKPQECLTSHPVSKKVNNSRYQAQDCVTQVDLSIEAKPKLSGSSSFMMSWLNKGKPQDLSQSSPVKRPKINS